MTKKEVLFSTARMLCDLYWLHARNEFWNAEKKLDYSARDSAERRMDAFSTARRIINLLEDEDIQALENWYDGLDKEYNETWNK